MILEAVVLNLAAYLQRCWSVENTVGSNCPRHSDGSLDNQDSNIGHDVVEGTNSDLKKHENKSDEIK